MSDRALHTQRTCVVIPTYNNGGTIARVVGEVLRHTSDVIVVNDGSTDATASILSTIKGITVVTHTENQGKGGALLSGFSKAHEMGFVNAITIDGDGQHYPSDLPKFFDAAATHPGCIIVGSRNLNQKNMNGKSKFANKFSNFWFTVQTWMRLPDTQTGFRLYPLDKLRWTHLITSRYESELELMVYAAWHNVGIVPIQVDVYYPAPEERVSHFRPGYDFFRISVLNTLLCIAAIVYGYPRMLLGRLRKGGDR